MFRIWSHVVDGMGRRMSNRDGVKYIFRQGFTRRSNNIIEVDAENLLSDARLL